MPRARSEAIWPSMITCATWTPFGWSSRERLRERAEAELADGERREARRPAQRRRRAREEHRARALAEHRRRDGARPKESAEAAHLPRGLEDGRRDVEQAAHVKGRRVVH